MTTCSGTTSRQTPDPALIEALRADLQRLDFTVEAVEELLGPVAVAALGRDQRLPAVRRLTAPALARNPLATAVGFFTLGLPAEPEAVAAAFPRTAVPGLRRLGLIGPPAGAGSTATPLRAACDLRPYGDEAHAWWVVSDLGELATGGPLRTDHVLGVGGASATLASWTPRAAIDRALDLGTGCGVQALHLSGHARRVVATDLSARALGYAALTAALADQDWDLRHGDLFAPVGGERFDLIVSNPPFVITPRRGDVPRYEYRDGGRTGDAIVADLVANAGAHLNPGGIAQFLGNWELVAGQDWRQLWGQWLDGTGLDAHVVQREVQDAAEYAETWARDGGQRPGTPAYDALVAAWLDDFDQRGVAHIGFGVVTLRRPATERAPYAELTEHRGHVAAPMGPELLAALAARDWLARHEPSLPAAVLDRRWLLAADVTEERHGRPGEPDPAVLLLRRGGGLGATLRADTVLAAFAGVCDGDLTAGQALGGIAALLDVPVADVTAAAWPGIERLIAEGFVHPAPDGGA